MAFRAFLIIFFSTFFQTAFSQETPYYQEPEKRKYAYEKITMPNLSSYTIKYYLSLNGGFAKSYHHSGGDLTNIVEVKSPMDTYKELNFGINHNEKYYLETGISHQKLQLNSYYGFPFRIFNEQSIFLLPFKVRKTVWVLDKVSRAAFLMVGTGVNFRVNKLQESEISEKLYFKYGQPPEQNDPESIDYKTLKKFPLLNFETNMEIRGKVTERFELGLFAKVLFSGKKNLSNELNLNYFNGQTEKQSDRLKGVQLWFGLNCRINSPAYYRYQSKVE